ncbi:retrotransposon protein, putative, ty1-copia subclass [Tanacetum coccineum]
MREFHSCKQEEGQSVSSYVLKMKGYINILERLGNPVTLGLAVSLILISLCKEFDGFVQNYNMHSLGKTVNELHAMLKLYEQTLILPKNNAPALHAIRAGKKRNCPQYLAELLKKKKNAASRAGGSGSKGNRKLKPGLLALEAMVQREAVEAIGNLIYLSLARLVIVLHNFIMLPSITKELFHAIPRDGIFEIDLFNSYANKSSIYIVSNKRAKLDLDSALLWHCRLGHISKKHIEKLQHDGLLNSTDLGDFEKCVPCMSGKMARKPYTHQVERPKDLLGLIHIDVCGPFKIMSRQGASYFVTFTDDFSRYGYVYLLKHKYEVFKTFKVFQKEVENQLKRMCLYIDAEEHELGNLGEPANYKPALLDTESDKLLNAMNVEMQSMKHNEVWVLVKLPPNGKTIGSKWLFKKKTDMDGAVHTYKARLVANGYTQTPRIDYKETFSPVADIRAIRILIAIVAYYD